MIFGRIPGLDKPVSRVCQGTTMLSEEHMAWSYELLDAVFDAGINTFDSAHLYGGGVCDRVFGEWVRRRGVRDEIVLMDKGAHHDKERRRVTPSDIAADLNVCLERLGFDTIDIFTLHLDDESQSVGPIVEELNRHLAEGTIHAFGASNWHHERIREANAYAKANGLTGFCLSSPHYSLAEQIEEPWADSVSIAGQTGEGARAFYIREKFPVFPWSSLSGGFFSGRFTPENLASLSTPADRRCVRCYCSQGNFARLARARAIAEDRDVTVAQIALAWVLTDPLDCYPLTSAWTPEEARQNAAAVEIELSNAERDWLALERDDR